MFGHVGNREKRRYLICGSNQLYFFDPKKIQLIEGARSPMIYIFQILVCGCGVYILLGSSVKEPVVWMLHRCAAAMPIRNPTTRVRPKAQTFEWKI
jgi:hypothetical protein